MKDRDWPALAAAIGRAEADATRVGVCAVAPDGGRLSHRGTGRFVAASTVKIAVMVELFRRVDAGALALDSVRVLDAQDCANGSGVLCHLHPGLAPTLGDLAWLMMAISDNTATNVLIDRLGMAAIGATMRDLGMRGSVLARRMGDAAAQARGEENLALPDEYAALVLALLGGQAASAGSCAAMLALMQAQQNDRRIARHLPAQGRPRWGSKTGSLPGVCNDVGYVFTQAGPLVLALFAADPPTPHEGERILGDLARAALEDCAA